MKRDRVLAVFGAATVVFLLSGCYESRQFIQADELASGYEQAGYSFSNPRDTTQEDCDEDQPCEQAITANELQIFKFASREDAADAAARFGTSGYQSNWIVLHYTDPDLTQQERDRFEGYVDSVNVSD